MSQCDICIELQQAKSPSVTTPAPVAYRLQDSETGQGRNVCLLPVHIVLGFENILGKRDDAILHVAKKGA